MKELLKTAMFLNGAYNQLDRNISHHFNTQKSNERVNKIQKKLDELCEIHNAKLIRKIGTYTNLHTTGVICGVIANGKTYAINLSDVDKNRIAERLKYETEWELRHGRPFKREPRKMK